MRSDLVWTVVWLTICTAAQPERARLTRLPLRASWFRDDQATFNPAAVYDDQLGWIVLSRQAPTHQQRPQQGCARLFLDLVVNTLYVCRHDSCYYRRPGCGVSKLQTKPVVSLMGKQPEPSVADTQYRSEIWSYGKSFDDAVHWSNSSTFQAEDFRQVQPIPTDLPSFVNFWLCWTDWGVCRPFMWDGAIYASHSLILLGADGRHPQNGITNMPLNLISTMAVSKMDFEHKLLELKGLFDHSHVAHGDQSKIEKNWAFVADGEQLVLIYNILSCAIAYDVSNIVHGLHMQDDAEDKLQFFMQTISMQSASCVALSNINLNSVLGHIHGSGHLVPWRRDGKKGYLALVHTTHTDGKLNYCHWAVRLTALFQVRCVNRTLLTCSCHCTLFPPASSVLTL